MVTLRSSSPLEPAPRARRPAAETALQTAAPVVIVGGVVFWLGYDSGAYGLTSRSAFAILVWWAIVLAAVLPVRLFKRFGAAGAVAGASLAGFAAWTLASTAWAPDAAAAFGEFARTALYLGVFVVTVLWCGRRQLTRWTDGIALGVTAVILLALASRFFPSVIARGSSLPFLQVGGTRLSYPVGYWNALGALSALATPLLLRAATSATRAAVRGLALAPLPAFATAVYLTSSRGAAIELGIAVFVFFVFTRRRATATVAVAAGAVATMPIALYLAHGSAIVDGPLDSQAARHQGAVAAAILVVSCALLAVGYAWGLRLAARWSPSTDRVERPLLVVGLVAVVAAIAASNPVSLFHQFKYSPVAGGSATSGPTVSQHFFSVSGNGRWEYWTIAVREFRNHPLVGAGAGAYQAWYERYRTHNSFAKNAHSLYLETMGDLGLVGFLLVLGFVLTPLAVGVRQRLRARGEHATTLAAVLAGFTAYSVAAGVDWVWQIPAVTVPAIVLLALLVTPAARPAVVASARSVPMLLRVAAVAVGIAIVAAEAIPMLAQVQLDASQAAARRGDAATALRHARSAEAIESWSPDPYLQIALLQEEAGALGAARAAIHEAVVRNDSDWRLWLVQARLQAKTGAIRAATRSLARAEELNPLWAAGLPHPAP